MKVVLFCGGLGTRLREHSDTIPKPLVSIGYRPILWHLMKYYAHFGHKEFILCLGYRGDQIREYFLNYDERLSTDFTMSEGGKKTVLLGDNIDDWTITFVDTGLHANVGQRLRAIRKYVESDEMFLANYSDGLSDLDLKLHVDRFLKTDAVAAFLSVRTWQSFHAVQAEENGLVKKFGIVSDSDFWVNGGFFVFRNSIFDYIEPEDELVEETFDKLIAAQKLISHKHRGFWQSMDTLKDKIAFDRMYARGRSPWELWKASDA